MVKLTNSLRDKTGRNIKENNNSIRLILFPLLVHDSCIERMASQEVHCSRAMGGVLRSTVANRFNLQNQHTDQHTVTCSDHRLGQPEDCSKVL